MARLFYMSLSGVGAWDATLREASAQLRPYRDYLQTALASAERNKPVLAWRPAEPGEQRTFQARLQERYARRALSTQQARKRRDRHAPTAPTGIWLVLEPPPWRPEEPNDTFDAFFDTRETFDAPGCAKTHQFDIRAHDREGRALLVDRLPSPLIPEPEEEAQEQRPPTATHPRGPLLWLRPHTHPLLCQHQAVRELNDRPAPRLAPLSRLLSTRAQWGTVQSMDIREDEWTFLRAEQPGQPLRDGTEEQRRFVSIARGTPDFAILEGPPGSGKSTAICELIVQLTRLGQRVLLVASTHVAVDNVLDRLLEWQDTLAEKPLLPIRIGEEDRIRAERVIPWTYKRLLNTWRDELLDFLDSPGSEVAPAGNAARQMLREAMNRPQTQGTEPLTRLLLESANLVCGTTIGILQHPAIRATRQGEPFEPFDVMILDEASKTTFSEFLVPALHARKWIVVGDVRQLSPYVEETHLAENVRGLLPETQARAAAHAFLASQGGRNRQSALVAVHSNEEATLLADEADARNVAYVDLDSAMPQMLRKIPGAVPELLYAELVFGSPETLQSFEHRLPGDLQLSSGALPTMPSWEALRRALGTETAEEPVDWAYEVAWRLVRSHELRQSEDRQARYLKDIEALLPVTLNEEQRGRLQRALHNIRRVALPSILELLQEGFERLDGWKDDVALTAGLPREHLQTRLTSLSFQRRMHPHISAFPRERFYTQAPKAGPQTVPKFTMAIRGRVWEPPPPALPRVLLQDASSVASERDWSYSRYARHALWLDIAPEKRHRGARYRANENPAEGRKVLEELDAFVEWARGNPHRDRKGRLIPWEVALLTFYRGQETFLREALKKRPGQGGNTFHFTLGEGTVHVTLGTVDRFQGQEADLVLLSFVKSGAVGFLDSPNRLNVAITRARYQLVLVGHRTYFSAEDRCPAELLRALAASPFYGGDISWEAKR
ncbi:AAA domain-containing protein [Stigmatella sp. ncwal1]|uniref:AAA domain-containing protein n=1 Tax=Stigmatella ashevillensis TaxID=2995309 RepID=A0ABT5DNK2_9BACT|nr:AAA domain-containing protein [Stigmatella ashevillena]MDC0715229.1 AAA domain-containing protein [Stigmatella ashevillena]